MAELETRVSFPLDQKSHKASLAALKSLDKAQKVPALTAKKSEVSYKAAARGMDKLVAGTRNLAQSSKQVDPALAREEKSIRKVDAAAKGAAKSIVQMDKAQGGLLSSANKFELKEFQQAGRLQSFALQNIGQFAPGAAGGAAVSQFSGAFNLLDTIPKLDLTFVALKESVVENISAIGARGAGYIGALGGAAIVIGIATLAMHLMNKSIEETTEATKKHSEQLELDRVITRDISGLLAAGDFAAAIELRNVKFAEAADAGRAQAIQEQELVRLRAAHIRPTSEEDIDVLADAEIEKQRQLVEAFAANSEIAHTAFLSADLAIADVSETERNRVVHVAALADIEQQLITIELKRTQILAQQGQTQQRVAGIEQQRTDLIVSNALKASRTEEDALLTAGFAREDDLAQQQKHFDMLEAIAEEGRQRLEIIQSELSNLPIERMAELQRIENEGNAKIGDLNADFMAAQIEKIHDFHKQTTRAESDNRRARLRLIEDITSELEDAARENNVVAFLKAQRSGATRLRRQTQDDQTKEQRRVEDFALQQTKAADAQQKRIQAAIEGIEIEKQKTIEAFTERRIQLAETLEVEKATIEAATQATLDRYNAQEAREAQLADRQSQRDAIRDGRAETAHTEALDRIDVREAAERAVLDGLLLQIDTLNSHQAILTKRESGLVGVPSSLPQTFSRGGSALTRLAHGGIVTRPTIALIGERGPEAVIPLGNTAGLPFGNRNQSGSRGSNIPVNVTLNSNVTIGDIATKSQVSDAINRSNLFAMKELHRLFEESGMVA